MVNPTKKYLKVKCDYCGESFLKYYSKIKLNPRNFCSLKCSHLKSLGRHWPNRKKEFINPGGYRLIRRNELKILEHRFIMESHLGRPLRKEEVIHHINENKLDNRIENLQITTYKDHKKLHLAGKWSLKHDCCVDCGGMSKKHTGHGLCKICYERLKRKRAVNPITK